MAFRPFSRQDIIARLKGTSLGGISGNYDPRKTQWENAGTEDVLGREETDWPDTTFEGAKTSESYSPPGRGIGTFDPTAPSGPSYLPQGITPQLPPIPPEMDVPGFGAFTYGPNKDVVRFDETVQADAWPHDYQGYIGGSDFNAPRGSTGHVGVGEAAPLPLDLKSQKSIPDGGPIPEDRPWPLDPIPAKTSSPA